MSWLKKSKLGFIIKLPDEEKVAAGINELLSAGLDELMVSSVPVTGTGEDEQQQQANS